MKKEYVLLGLLFLVSLIPLGSSEILFGQTQNLYNLGDNLNVSIKLNPGVDTDGFFSVILDCGNDIEVYRSVESLTTGETKIVDITAKVTRTILGNSTGICRIRAKFGDEEKETSSFEITDNVDLSFSAEGVVFSPGEEVVVSGKAVKSNGQMLQGFVEVSVEDIGVRVSEQVSNGDINFIFKILGNSKAGTFTLKVIAYDKDSKGEIANHGESEQIIKVRQVKTSAGVAFNLEDITPGNELVYQPMLYDQAGDEILEDVGLTIYTPNKEVFDKLIVRSGETRRMFVEKNQIAGYWRFVVSSGDISGEKLVLVEELRSISFELVNQTLLVVNDGNVRYQGPVEVTIGEVTEIKELDLKIGEIKRYRLIAPDGEYSIEVSSGEEKRVLGSTLLTGRAISIDELSSGLASFTTLIWFFIIVVLAVIGYYLYRRARKNGFQRIVQRTQKNEKRGDISPGEIENGKRENATVISLKLKNFGEVGDRRNSDCIDRALMKAKVKGAKVYLDGEYRIILFSKTLTGNAENALSGVGVAKEIEEWLETCNRTYPKKIRFGIGMNSGEIGVEEKSGKFKFSSIGNTIGIAKRISDMSSGELLLSEKLHGVLAGKIKIEKQGDVWKVLKVTDRTKHEDFVNRFVRSQGKK